MRRPAFLLAALLIAPAFAHAAPLNPGAQAPLFSRPDFAGRAVSLQAYRGKLVLLDFWASWCAPCLEAIPHLIALQKSDAAKLQVIGVSMDDAPGDALKLSKRYAFNYPLLMGDAKFGSLYGGILGLPVVFLIGRDGKVLKVWRNDVTPQELTRAIAAAS